jgi:TonB family protein
MDKNKRGKYVGVLGTIVAHAALLALLIFISFTIPHNDDEGGVPVMMGDVESAQEGADNSLVDVDILPEEAAAQPAAAPSTPEAPKEEPIITQETEKSVEVKKTKAKVEKTTPKAKPVETPKKAEKSEAEIAAEKKRLAEAKAEAERKAAEAKAEAERKAAAEAASKRVAGAFGKGNKMGNSSGTSDSGTGKEGSKNGNSTTGAKSGVGGTGASFNLGGRSLGSGGLPRPSYSGQEEGKVVVSIVVNPAGKVIDASINIGQTNTVSTTLRKAALEAARKASFNEVSGVNNQSGTITYYFTLK